MEHELAYWSRVREERTIDSNAENVYGAYCYTSYSSLENKATRNWQLGCSSFENKVPQTEDLNEVLANS